LGAGYSEVENASNKKYTKQSQSKCTTDFKTMENKEYDLIILTDQEHRILDELEIKEELYNN